MSNNRSKARQKFLELVPPSTKPTHTSVQRSQWIDKLCADFVHPSQANKAYYRVVVELLWPPGHGIPGPKVSEEQIRNAIDNFRKTNQFGNHPDKPYVDVFRRVRELQGEEGLTGVARGGKTFQLVNLDVSTKRVPRTKLSDLEWERVKTSYNHTCPACNRTEPNVRFQQDHKIPRTRGGLDGLENWQPLCDECNNFKSVACRGCNLDCATCCWAYPEKYAPIHIKPVTLAKLYDHCRANSLDINYYIESLILESIKSA